MNQTLLTDVIDEHPDYLKKIINTLHEYRNIPPDNRLVQELGILLNNLTILEQQKFWINLNLDLMLMIMDIIKNCFEDNIYSCITIDISCEIIYRMYQQENISMTDQFRTIFRSKYWYCSDAATTTAVNLETGNDINNTDMHVNRISEISVDQIHQSILSITDYLKLKWQNEKNYSYPKLRANSTNNTGRKLCNTIIKYEEHLMKLLQNRWEMLERRFEKIPLKKQETQELFENILERINHIRVKYNIPYSSVPKNSSVTPSLVPNSSIQIKYSSENHDTAVAKNISDKNDMDNKNEDLSGHITDSMINVNSESINDDKQQLDNDKIEKITMSVENNHECYINFSKIWNENSRWSSIKHKLVLKGTNLINDNVRVSFPVYRQEFIISDYIGTFGYVEIGFTKNFHAIALKRLTADCKRLSIDQCLKIHQYLENLKKLTTHLNLLKIYSIQDYCGHTFIYTKLCDYNLIEFIKKLKLDRKWNSEEIHRICLEIIKGLAALHLCQPMILHGNLKPTNILIDDNGSVKLTDFGLSEFAYSSQTDNKNIFNNTMKIWWSPEKYALFEFSNVYNCTTMSDIYECGLVFHYVNSGGIHPFGDDVSDILRNMQLQQPKFVINYLDVQDILSEMFNVNPLKRPTISEVYNHIYFWSNEKRWKFLEKSIKIIIFEITDDELKDNENFQKFCSIFRINLLEFNLRETLNVTNDVVQIPSSTPQLSPDVQEQTKIDINLDFLIFFKKCEIDCRLYCSQNICQFIEIYYSKLSVIMYKSLKESNLYQQDKFKMLSQIFI